MRAVVLDSYGGPEVLRVEDVPDPVPRTGEVIIAVAAAGVNRADTSQRRGTYPPPPGAPLYPGLECSGTVVARGAGATKWQVGDEVCALLGGGGYAEFVAVSEAHVLPRPELTTLTDAAALPEAACTVVANLLGTNGLRHGESILIHGGGSGIGTMAIQYARALGATVVCTAGSDAKVELCRELGAHAGINYHTDDFVQAALDATEGRGVDVVLDIVGAEYLIRNLAALASMGRMLSVGVQSGSLAQIDLREVLQKRLVLTGSTLRSRSHAEKTLIVDTVVQQIWPLLASGQVRPVVDTRLPLHQANQAHYRLESSEHFGKIVLLPRQTV